MNRTLTLVAVTACAVLGLSSCQGAEVSHKAPEPETTHAPNSAEHADAAAQGADEFIAPERIASLSYESTEVLAALGLAPSLVLMPEAVMNPVLGAHQRELAEVPRTYAVERELSAEGVIQADPDLVIMTPRHGASETLGEVLGHAGIATLSTPNHWSTPAELVANVRMIGEAVGKADAANALAAELESGLVPREAAAAGARVLVLSNQAGRPFVTAGQAFPLELLHLAGGIDVSAELGITKSGVITAEQIIELAPDGIVLIDMNGTGDRFFAELLDHEALATLPALAHDRVLRVEGREVQALGLTATIGGLDRLANWLAGILRG